ncbi:MAG: phage protein Gp36 family protein [Bacilli bacterium]
MSYATAAAFALRLGTVYASIYRNNEPAALEDLAQASAEIDAYLGGRYFVPVTAAASLVLLTEWNLTLAEEKAYARGGGSSIPEKVIRRVDAVRKQLRDAASGLLRLPGAAEAGASGSGGAGAVLIEIETPVFGRKKMKGY